MKKDFTAAIQYLDKIIEVDPGNVDAANNKKVLEKANNKGASQAGSAKPTSGQPKPSGQ